MFLTLFNFIGFYLGWWACAYLGIKDLSWYAIGVAFAFCSIHLYFTPNRKGELKFILFMASWGFIQDTLCAAAGVFHFPREPLGWIFSPPWLVSMWAMYATSFSTSMRFLVGRYKWAAVLGAVFGPLSYFAGGKLGILVFHPPEYMMIVISSVVWGIATPIQFWLFSRYFFPGDLARPNKAAKP